MNGILAMLSGKGEQENQKRHKAFRDAIPDSYPADLTVEERAAQHPAYSGPLANTMQAADYRRAHYGGKGPQSKAEHAAFARRQALMEEYERKVKREGQVERVLSFDEIGGDD
jgi:hypothetical protein